MNKNTQDIIGLRSNKLLVISDAPSFTTDGGYKYACVRCACDCGKQVVLRKSAVKSGKYKSCGCSRFEKDGTEHKRHGMYGTRPYQIWYAMWQRCTDVNQESFKYYGERGISICDKWKSFYGFWEDMQQGYADNLSIDRVDVDKNYSKENCRWATDSVQAYNKRFSKLNKSGKTGVHWDNKSNKWRVKFTKDSVVHEPSLHLYLWDAIVERQRLEMLHWGYTKE